MTETTNAGSPRRVEDMNPHKFQAQRYSFSVDYPNDNATKTETTNNNQLKSISRVRQQITDTDKREVQMRRVRNAFRERPKSRMDVALETGIFLQNVCRYVGHLREQNLIQVHHKGIDQTTGFTVEFLTTDPALFVIPDVPPTLFD